MGVQNESLNIEVHEKGSSNVVDMFSKIAAEARAAQIAIKKLRKEVGGPGTIKEATKGGRGSNAAKEHANAVKRSQAEIRNAMKKTADLHTKMNKDQNEISNKMRMRANEVQKSLNKEAAAEKALAKTKRAQMQATWDRRKRIFDKRRAEILKIRNVEKAAAAARGKQTAKDQTTLFAKTDQFVVGKLKAEAAAHKSAARAARKHDISLRGLTDTVTKQSAGLRGLGNQVFFAQRAFAALGGALILRGFLSISDQAQNMTNRIGLVTDGTEEFNDVQTKLQDISRTTRQSLGATVETYVRLRKATESSGVSQTRLMGVLTTLNQMLAVSGATATEAEQSIRQLSQAFSKGKLDGDEFKSVAEAMPSIVTALEKSLNKTNGEIRAMSEAGKLTTDILIKAFEANKQQAADDFGKSIRTIGQAWTVLKNEVLEAVGAFNTSTGAIGLIVDGTILLAENLWVVELALQAIAAYGFLSLIKGLKLLTNMLLTRTIPAVWSYVAAMRAASTTGFIGPKLPGGGFFSKGPNGIVQKLGRARMGVAALTAEFGVMTTAALVAGSAFAGFKLGGFVDDFLDISGRASEWAVGVVHGIETADVSATDVINKHTKTLDTLSKKRKEMIDDGASTKNLISINKEIDALKKKIQLNEKARKAQEDILKAARAVELEAVRVAKAARDHAEAVKKAEKSWKGMEQSIFPARVEARKLKEEFQAAVEAAELLGKDTFNIAAFTGMKAQQAANPGQTLLLAKQEEVRLASIQNDKERERQTALSQSAETLKDMLGAEVQMWEIRNTGQFTPRWTKDQLKLLNDLTDEQIKLNAANAKHGRRGKKQKDSGLQALLESLNPVRAAQAKLADGFDVLAIATKRGEISAKDAKDVYEQLKDTMIDTLEPFKALDRENEKALSMLGMTTAQIEEHNKINEVKAAIIASNTAATKDQVSEQLAAWLATRDLVEQATEHADAVEGVTNSIQSRTQAMDEYAIALEGIDAHRSLDAEERQLSILEAQKTLYPQIADELDRLHQGTLGLSAARLEQHSIQDTLVTKEAAIIQAYFDGNKNLQEKIALLAAVRQEAKLAEDAAKLAHSSFRDVASLLTEDALEDLWIGVVTQAFQALEDAVVEGVLNMQDAFFDLVTTGDTSVDVFDNMKDSFSTAVDSMLEDITRLLIRMALIATLKATIGQGTMIDLGILQAKRHGGSVKTTNLPRFANGGSMQVGGVGGPDTKLVQFMASPGENVHVTNPGQSRLDNRQSQQAPAAAPVVINNYTDPADIVQAISTPAGARAILNVIQQNGEAVKRFQR